MTVVQPVALYQDLIKDTNDAFLGIEGDVKQVAAKAIRSSFLKKFKDTSSDIADANAISKFLSVNDRCRTWRSDVKSSLFIDELVGHFKVALHEFFEPDNRRPLVSSVDQILDLARTGPGAAIGSNGGDFYTKIASADLSSTSSFLYAAYANYIKNHPLWQETENNRLTAGFGNSIVRGNRVSCVAKNVDISRTICIEPNLNMFFQLGLGEIIERRLKAVYSIDLADQADVNRELARIGSLDDNLCTIDLESASDSISLSMLKYVLPRDIFAWFNLLRSKEATLPSGTVQELYMVSTMGNGFTFPLQTALFSCAISACFAFLGFKGQQKAGHSWSVFGDDIIIPREIAEPMINLLDYLGFVVNEQKSFFEGPFRESCGLDFYRGKNVRGVYVKTLKLPQSRCALLNVLNRWSAQTGINLPSVARTLLKSVRLMPVPPWENDDAGVKVPFSLLKSVKRSKRYQSIIYRRYQSAPRQITFGDGTVKYPRGVKPRFYNGAGLLMAMLQGTVQDGKINIRHSVSLYRNTTGVAPNWDHSYTASKSSLDILLSSSFKPAPFELDDYEVILRERCLLQEPGDWLRWRTAVEANLSPLWG